MIHDAARGAPRLINNMCNAALIAAYGAGETRVTYAMAMEAIDERFGHDPKDGPRRSPVAARPAAKPAVLRQLEAATEKSGAEDSQDRALLDRIERAITAAETVAPAAGACQHGATGLTRGHPADANKIIDRLADATEEAGLRLEGMQSRLDAVFDEAEQRLASLESRLDSAGAAARKLDEPLHRIDAASGSAAAIETRLSEFAEQIAEKASDLQNRVAVLMGALESSDLTAERLETVIAKAESLPHQAQKTTQEAMAQVEGEIEQSIRSHRKQLEKLVAESANKLDDCSKLCHVEQQRVLDRMEEEVHQKTQRAMEELERNGDRVARVLSTVVDGATCEADAIQARVKEAIEQGGAFRDEFIEHGRQPIRYRVA